MIAPAFKYRRCDQRLFEMKKGTIFSVRQDQQNDAQVFVSFFEKNTAASQKKRCSKRALAECICPKRETARFESWQTL
ncbi:MAG: hypothetical protein EGR01_03375 [Clostridiales bacterium]|nr:hypothetical protein [Clostridiales bacterium]